MLTPNPTFASLRGSPFRRQRRSIEPCDHEAAMKYHVHWIHQRDSREPIAPQSCKWLQGDQKQINSAPERAACQEEATHNPSLPHPP